MNGWLAHLATRLGAHSDVVDAHCERLVVLAVDNHQRVAGRQQLLRLARIAVRVRL